MSLCSMTGYGYGAATGNGFKIVVELSSVNRKQLDVNLKTHKSLVSFEGRIQELVHKFITRGRVNADIDLIYYGNLCRETVNIDHELAGAYVDKLQKTAKLLNISDEIRIDHLINLPGIVRYEQPKVDAEKIWKVLSKALQTALRALQQMRSVEGVALKKELEFRLSLLKNFLEKIKKEAPVVIERYKKSLCDRLHSVSKMETEDGKLRLEKELIFFADRSDITEEIARLDCHLQQGYKVMRSKEPSGRTLDFLAQELFREINTIGSKANDSDISNLVVNFKTELERFREQAQNIE